MKTLEELQKLSDDELRVMLAKLRGWRLINPPLIEGDGPYWNDPNGVFQGGGSYNPLPNYPADLNACHEVEETFYERPSLSTDFLEWLQKIVGVTHPIHATARQRTIALILTLQKP